MTQEELKMKIPTLVQEHAPNDAPAPGEVMRTVPRNIQANDSPMPSLFPTKLNLSDLGDPEVYVNFSGARSVSPRFPILRVQRMRLATIAPPNQGL